MPAQMASAKPRQPVKIAIGEHQHRPSHQDADGSAWQTGEEPSRISGPGKKAIQTLS